MNQRTATPDASQPGLVSIIMPAYHAERYLDESLTTVERQSYKQWEMIVVEDGSEGDTEKIVRAFAARVSDRRVLYVRHKTNQGPSAARNTALAEARGEFVAFLDADDIWLENHLEKSVETLRAEKADVAFSTVLMFESDTGHLVGLWGPTRERLLGTRPALRTFPNWLFHRNFITPSATVLRRSVFEAAGTFNPNLRSSEDLDLWLRCIKAGMKFEHLPGCHCLHRKGHAEAATNNLTEILRVQAGVLEEYLGMSAIPMRVQQWQVTYFYTAAGMFSLENDASAAGRLFFRGWRVTPVRIDLLMLAAASMLIMRFLPSLGIVRRIKQARGY